MFLSDSEFFCLRHETILGHDLYANTCMTQMILQELQLKKLIFMILELVISELEVVVKFMILMILQELQLKKQIYMI
eukprot:COSAG05_NODE_2429_length_3073_cov_8.454270_3_plen_77_part_00